MRSWYRILLGAVLVAAVAAAGIALNFALLGLTEENSDRVGKLSPRAVLDPGTASTTTPTTTVPTATTPATTTDDSGPTETDGGVDGQRNNDDGLEPDDD